MRIMLRCAGLGLIVVVLSVLSIALVAGESAQEPPAAAAADEAAFDLKEFSVVDEPARSDLLRGQAAYCQAEPFAQVKKYPAMKSKHPWYGEVVFARQLGEPGSGKTFYFAVDESQQQRDPNKSHSPQSVRTED
jgi:hypothetical protein